MGVVSTTPLQQHGKKLFEMVHKEDGIDFLQSYGILRIFDGRHRHTVIAQIEE